jgi:hypothetical protein
VNFHAGFKCQTYDSSDIITDKAFVGFVAKGGLDYFITDDDDIILSLERDVYDSIYQNMSYYTLNFAGLRWAHRFSDKISASVYGSFQYNIYPSQSTENGTTATRYDNDLGFGASLRYDIRKWASVEAKYDFRQRICKFDTFDYIDNQITLNGTVGF